MRTFRSRDPRLPIESVSRKDRGPHSGNRALAAFIPAMLCVALAITPVAARGGDEPARGPVVAIPDCRIISEGCSLDDASPDLSGAGCAVSLAGQLQRRGITSQLIGPTTVLCGPGSSTVVLEASITATCPNRAENELPLNQVKQVDLFGTLVMRDCNTGEIVGRAEARRSIDWQRRTLIRDLTEELGHHIKELAIRRSHPHTPVRWMKADVGGEHTLELGGGFVDVEDNKLNDYLSGIGLAREQYGYRLVLETGYHPWKDDNYTMAFGLEALKFESEGTGNFLADSLGVDPSSLASVPGQTRVKATMQVIGMRASLGYGLDFTRNQRVSLQGSVGYYILGPAFAPAVIEVDGLTAGEFELRDATGGFSGEARYEWRFTPHLGFSVMGGWNYLNFHRPNRVDRTADLPFNIEFTGVTGRAGLSARF
jgi:hypothetical protein